MSRHTTGILVEDSTNVKIEGPGMISFFGTGLEYSSSAGGAARDLYIGNNEKASESQGNELAGDSSNQTADRQRGFQHGCHTQM
jgi:hypothetical protein